MASAAVALLIPASDERTAVQRTACHVLHFISDGSPGTLRDVITILLLMRTDRRIVKLRGGETHRSDSSAANPHKVSLDVNRNGPASISRSGTIPMQGRQPSLPSAASAISANPAMMRRERSMVPTLGRIA